MTLKIDQEEELAREDLLNAIEEMIEDGDIGDAITWCDSHLVQFPDDPEAFVLKGHAMAELGDFNTALALYQKARTLVPDWEDAALTSAGVMLELNRIDDAREMLTELLEKHESDPHVHYTLAIAHDIAGNELGAHRHYTIAAQLGVQYHQPFKVSLKAFNTLADEIIEALPTPYKHALAEVDLTITDVPNANVKSIHSRNISPLTLGCFIDLPLNAQPDQQKDSRSQGQIILFKKNLERVSRNRMELKEQIDATLQHELVHYLGQGPSRK